MEIILSELILKYGVLGLWLAFMILHNFYLEKEINKTVSKNTDAINKMSGIIEMLHRK